MENSYPISGVNSNWAYPILEPADIETQFLELAQQWRRETGMMSLVTKMSMHPAYQRIIGMGQPVVPLIKPIQAWDIPLNTRPGQNPRLYYSRGFAFKPSLQNNRWVKFLWAQLTVSPFPTSPPCAW